MREEGYVQYILKYSWVLENCDKSGQVQVYDLEETDKLHNQTKLFPRKCKNKERQIVSRKEEKPIDPESPPPPRQFLVQSCGQLPFLEQTDLGSESDKALPSLQLVPSCHGAHLGAIWATHPHKGS